VTRPEVYWKKGPKGCSWAQIVGVLRQAQDRLFDSASCDETAGGFAQDDGVKQTTAGSFDKLRTGSSTPLLAKCASSYAQDDGLCV